MRYATFPAALLALVLLVAVPVGGAPNLQVGSTATYNLSVKVSFSQPICETVANATTQSDVIACPPGPANFPSIVLNGTIGWTTTGLNSTTAVLNVTRDLSTYFGNHTFTSTGSLSESIFLANRTVSLMPFIMPDMDQALQLAQNDLATTGVSNWTSSMSMINDAIWFRPHIYTMWWVNGPLKLNETVPVTVFPTNVTSQSSIDLGGLGTWSAWNLTYSLPPFIQDPPLAYAVPVGDNFQSFFSFNYGQQSDLLLSASADLHFGFFAPLSYQTNGCAPSATLKCPYSTTADCISIIDSGINVQASLTLAKTSLDLTQRSSSGGNGSGTDSGSGSGGSETGSGTGGSSGGTGTGGSNSGSSSSGTNSGSNGSTSSGTNSGNGAGANGSVNSGGNTPSSSTKPATSFPWVLVILALVAAAIIAGSAYYIRQRSTKNKPLTSTS